MKKIIMLIRTQETALSFTYKFGVSSTFGEYGRSSFLPLLPSGLPFTLVRSPQEEIEEERRAMEIEVREVWAWNLKEEMEMIASIKDSFPFVAFDTEFPGFIASSSRGATPDELYGDVKLNVDSLKLIQVGLAFFDGFGMLPCSKPFCGVVWQFNLSDFDPSGDCHSPSAVEFLKENGIDFTASRRQGIASMRLCEEFWAAGLLGNPRLAWLCFHGTYDFAYMLKLIEGGEPLPSTRREFMEKVNRLFCNIYDLKYMAKFYDELRHGKLGLRRMAEILGVEEYLENSREEEEVKEGEGKHRYHQAGWDSLVTGMSFFQMDMIQEIQAMKQSSGDMPVVVDLSGLNAVLNGSNGVIFDMGTELIDAADAATDHLMAAYIWIDVKELCCCH